MESSRHPLSYSRLRNEPHKPSFVIALLLCAPGACSWLTYFGIAARDPFAAMSVMHWLGGPDLFWLLFFAAVATAISSIIIYFKYPRFRPMPWYVILNLCVNVSGLVFGLALFFSVL
jgi:hypothetical protein